jgi:hypothetical protein
MIGAVTTVLASAIAMISLGFNWLQYRHGHEQARVAGDRNQSQVAYSLVQWLEEPHNLAARREICALPDYVDRTSWSEAQRQSALQVSNLYQLAAQFDDTGALPPFFLVRSIQASLRALR